MFQPSLLRALLDMRPGRSVAATVRSHVSDARVAQMLDHFTQYVGSAPDQSPAVLCGIAHMQTNEGVWYPRGGTGGGAAGPGIAGARARRRAPVRRRCAAHPLGFRRPCAGAGNRLRRGNRAWPRSWRTQTACEPIATCIGGTPERRFKSRRRYEPACSGVVLYLGLDRALRASRASQFRLLAQPGGRV